MGNKKVDIVEINKERFMEVLKENRCSIRKLGKAYSDIGRTEKTIRYWLNDGHMPPDLLDKIAQYLNVHPDYLAGVYDKKADRIEDDMLRRMYLSHVKPENYPYLLKARSDIDYTRYFEDILTMNNISMDQFRALPPIERVLLRQEMVVAILEVIAKHFATDALGHDVQEELRYYKSFVDDFDPTSFFAELEGVGITEDELEEDHLEESEEEQRLREKYSHTEP